MCRNGRLSAVREDDATTGSQFNGLMKNSLAFVLFQLSIPGLLLLTVPACGDAEPDDGTEVSVSVNRTASNAPGTADDPVDEANADAPGATTTSGSTSSSVAGSGSGRVTAGQTSDNRTTAGSNQSTSGESSGSRSGRTSETGDVVPYSPATFDALLKKYVRNGRVNYGGFDSDAEFSRFVESLAEADPSSMSQDEALAFWVNAYNALVIRNVNDHPGTKNPLDVKGFFDGITFSVAGRSLTLNDIENKVIRPTYNEPLIHFGLVCAAVSCPPLISTAYTGANVRSTLRSNAEKYLGDSKQNRFDAASGTLWVSKIFEWYIADFGGSTEGIVTFVRKHAPADMAAKIEAAKNVTVKYNEYDWTLNSM